MTMTMTMKILYRLLKYNTLLSLVNIYLNILPNAVHNKNATSLEAAATIVQ